MLAGDCLPERSTNLVALYDLSITLSILLYIHCITYTLAGLKVDLYVKDSSAFCSCIVYTETRGTREVRVRDIVLWCKLTISRMMESWWCY